jgi:hypothetical protein
MTLTINDYFSLDITDALTSLDEILTSSTPTFITGTTRGHSNVVYNTHISYFRHSSSTQFSCVNSYSFALMFVLPAQIKPRNRRQTGGNYYLGQGQAVNNCSAAVTYTLINSQLFANASGGATQFGMTPGTSYANFTASASPGNITSIFSTDSANKLMWNNPSFYNNFAKFCIMPDQTIVAVFIDPTGEAVSCVFISLSMV